MKGSESAAIAGVNPGQSSGLSSRRARQLLARWGENRVTPRRRVHPVVELLKKFTSPLLLVLIGASLLSLFLGQRTNAAIILCMVAISGVLDFVNSYRSSRAVEALVSRVVTTANVRRDGHVQAVPLHLVVPGDVVELEPGNVVPADARVVEADDFFVNQSALTGESFPAEKAAGEQVFMGTAAVTGRAVVEVTATGPRTQYGAIAERLAAVPPVTEFERGVAGFSAFTMKVTVALVAITFAANYALGRDPLQSFIFAVAIAIGLTPELLPVIMSVSLSRGSAALARRSVLVKNLPSIQNLGAMDLLCTDKTGTLTEDRIDLVRYEDGFGQPDSYVFELAYVGSSFHTGVASPLDEAIRRHRQLDVSGYVKVDEVPFDFVRRRSSVVADHGDDRLLVVKGAAESVLEASVTCRRGGRAVPLGPGERNEIAATLARVSGQGFRVLGVAVRQLPLQPGTDSYSHHEERDLEFVGAMLFLDPPKEGAARAIAELEERGVEVKIITGDGEELTAKICGDLGVPVRGLMTGAEVEALDDARLAERLPATTVFARVNPVQKERLIKLLRSGGRVVGYLGDGINDAPALSAADVGISVSNAVEVAREAADIILLQKSLEVLRDGVVEGRRTFQNTMKYMMMGLSSNFGNMVSMTVASGALPFLPMLPSQVLLNNFLYDSSQVTLAGDNVDSSSLVKPARWDMGFIRRYMATFGLVSSLFDFATFALLLGVFRLGEGQFQAGWFLESLTTQVLVVYVIRTRLWPFVSSRPSRALLATTLCCVALAWLVVSLPPLAALFGFGRITPGVAAAVLGVAATYLLAVEATKRAFYRRLARVR